MTPPNGTVLENEDTSTPRQAVTSAHEEVVVDVAIVEDKVRETSNERSSLIHQNSYRNDPVASEEGKDYWNEMARVHSLHNLQQASRRPSPEAEPEGKPEEKLSTTVEPDTQQDVPMFVTEQDVSLARVASFVKDPNAVNDANDYWNDNLERVHSLHNLQQVSQAPETSHPKEEVPVEEETGGMKRVASYTKDSAATNDANDYWNDNMERVHSLRNLQQASKQPWVEETPDPPLEMPEEETDGGMIRVASYSKDPNAKEDANDYWNDNMKRVHSLKNLAQESKLPDNAPTPGSEGILKRISSYLHDPDALQDANDYWNDMARVHSLHNLQQLSKPAHDTVNSADSTTAVSRATSNSPKSMKRSVSFSQQGDQLLFFDGNAEPGKVQKSLSQTSLVNLTNSTKKSTTAEETSAVTPTIGFSLGKLFLWTFLVALVFFKLGAMMEAPQAAVTIQLPTLPEPEPQPEPKPQKKILSGIQKILNRKRKGMKAAEL